ncbi:MAG TPA: VCBS repeat-containing protein [Phycisphaerae bacterium]|nr:VCBS repeat-containing protein [Phycisphaerae bacterium]
MMLKSVRLVGLVVAVSCCLSTISRADIESIPLVVFSNSGDTKPYFAQWSGGTWSPGTGTAMTTVGANPEWVVVRNCPIRYESVCATVDSDKDINVMFHNGTSWTSPTEVCVNVGAGYQRSVDLAYENSSGDLMIAYWDSNANVVAYRTYNGTTLSAESTLALPTNTTMKFLALYPKPGSDQIILLTLQNNSNLNAFVWNGSSWGSGATLSTGLSWKDQEDIAVAYESLSGRAMVAYTRNSGATAAYRIWDGTSWSADTLIPGLVTWPQWVRLTSDPNSNTIIWSGIYKWSSTKTLDVCVWNGTSWGTPTQLESDFVDADSRRFDVAFEKGNSEALIVYQEGTQTSLRYRTWNGSSWSSEQVGTNIGEAANFIQLRTGGSTGEIFIAASDAGNDLEMVRWNGSSMSATQQLSSALGGSSTTEPFMMAMPAERVPARATIPYFTDFEATVGAEWSRPTQTSNATFSNFAGRHRTIPLDLGLYTTVGETYRLSFDFYAIDSWNGNNGTSGPDALQVAVNSTNVFNHTFTHETPASGASYPYVYDQSDHYGFDSGAKDAIYRKVEVVFTANSTVSTISFVGSLTDESGGGFNDESWGIDNVSVESARYLDVSSARSFAVQSSTSATNYGGGVAWADVDGDGDLDAVLSGNTARLLVSTSAGTSFTSSLLGDFRRHWALLDVENDGDMDLWTGAAAGYDAESCRLNNGSGSFSNGGDLGFPDPSTNEGIAAADVNGDGWCDVIMFSANGNWIGRHTASETPALAGSNNVADGLNDSGDYGDGDYVSSGDVNNDGYVDFFFHYGTGKLFVSDGDGTYTENAHGISVATGASAKFGSAWGDYDNDGDLDLYCARNAEGYTGYLWRNDRDWVAGTGGFTNVTTAAGFALNSGVDFTPDHAGTRSCAWGDYDNDGDLDLFIVGADGNPLLYQYQGGGVFARAAEGTTLTGALIDGSFVDFDNDGDLDLCVTRESGNAVLLENRVNNGNYLKVRAVGDGAGKTHKAAIGTRVELWNAAGTTLLARRDIGVARGFGGTEPQWAHFGGVTPTSTYQVKVHFVSGVLTKTVVPASTSTTIGSTVIPKMLTVSESNPAKVIKWNEVPNRAS